MPNTARPGLADRRQEVEPRAHPFGKRLRWSSPTGAASRRRESTATAARSAACRDARNVTRVWNAVDAWREVGTGSTANIPWCAARCLESNPATASLVEALLRMIEDRAVAADLARRIAERPIRTRCRSTKRPTRTSRSSVCLLDRALTSVRGLSAGRRTAASAGIEPFLTPRPDLTRSCACPNEGESAEWPSDHAIARPRPCSSLLRRAIEAATHDGLIREQVDRISSIASRYGDATDDRAR